MRKVEPKIRLATEADLPAINDIYNYYVLNSTCTFQTEPETSEDRARWFALHDELHPVTAAEIQGQVVGWASLSRYHARSAYRHTVEDSVYVREDLRSHGIGTALLKDLVERAKQLGHHSIVATISADQTGSIELHRRFNFLEAGHIREAGRKFDRWLDVILMQKML